MDHWWQKDISGCGLSGIINWDGKRISGEAIRKSIALQHDRGNGQGGGFAAYGIYPNHKDHYALHIMFTEEPGKPTRDFECKSAAVGYDPALHTIKEIERLTETLAPSGIKFVPVETESDRRFVGGSAEALGSSYSAARDRIFRSNCQRQDLGRAGRA